MAKILASKSIYYKDVCLIGRPNNLIKSRSEIPKRLDKIIVSPMAAICGETFLREALKLGLTVSLHRFCTIEEQCNLFKKIYYKNSNRIWAAIGLNDWERAYKLIDSGCTNLIIDVANGYLSCVGAGIDKLFYDPYPNRKLKLMVGNIHTEEGFNLYKEYDNIRVRIGIGGGSGCQSTLKTGIGRGAITEIMECYENRNGSQILLADGGQENPGYTALAFAAGADEVMIGGYFSKAEEAENIINREYKFWGSASYKQLEMSGSKKTHSEGKVINIDKSEIKPLKILVEELWGGIASAISYSGFNCLESFIGNGTFEVKI